MKKFWVNKFFILLVPLFFVGLANAQERDPFSPSGNGANLLKEVSVGSVTQGSNIGNQLTSTQLSGYKVIGVMISDAKKIAVVKTFGGSSHIVTIGDSLGNEGGKISDIALEEITVKTDNETIKLPVSNVVEAPLEKK